MGFSVARSNALFRGSSETIYIAGSPKGNYTGAIVFYRKGTPMKCRPSYYNSRNH